MVQRAPSLGRGVGRGLAGIALVAGALAALGAVTGCNAPKEPPEETRLYPKAPLTRMAPIIHGEKVGAMARLAHLNKPPVVLIPAESVTAAPKK